MTNRPPFALAHDYLTQRGGAERVVAEWVHRWPHVSLTTLLYEPNLCFPVFREADVRPSILNASRTLRRHHRYTLPLLAPVASHTTIDADVTLASSSGWAHGFRATGKLAVYCHAPARWLYQTERYYTHNALGQALKAAVSPLGMQLRAWDRRAAKRADVYFANSSFTAAQIRSIYGIDADVVPPPVTVPEHIPGDEDRSDVLVVARLLPYKNVDLAIELAKRRPELRFRVIGDGPLRQELEAHAPSNVSFAGVVTDEELWREYAGTRVHLALSFEDFGITPLEAAAAGKPTIARASGGYLDTIEPGATGFVVDEARLTTTELSGVLDEALQNAWNTETLREHARRFSPSEHLAKLEAGLRSRGLNPGA